MKQLLVLTTVLFACFSIVIQSCGENRNRQTRRSHEEAYTVNEKEEVTLTYLIENDKIYYERTDGVLAGLFANPRMKVYCTVTNTSDYNGTFKLYATMSSQGQKIEFEDEKFLKSGDTKILEQEIEINPCSFETGVEIDKWGIIAPRITVEKEVTKYRTVYDE